KHRDCAIPDRKKASGSRSWAILAEDQEAIAARRRRRSSGLFYPIPHGAGPCKGVISSAAPKRGSRCPQPRPSNPRHENPNARASESIRGEADALRQLGHVDTDLVADHLISLRLQDANCADAPRANALSSNSNRGKLGVLGSSSHRDPER